MEGMERVDVKPIKMSKEERLREAKILENASSEDLKNMFKDNLNSYTAQFKSSSKKEELQMTEEEAKRIESCMEKPEFMGLFREYVKDISDPKNMEEYDQYIRQLEEEGEIPANEEIVRPEKGLCIKTKSIDAESKIFINCAGTDKVPPPSQRPGSAPKTPGSSGDPGTGTHWSIPYVYTSVRMDRDKHDEPCHVYDILFNSLALRMSEKDARFKAIVVQTALEALEDNGKVKLRDAKTGKFNFTVMQNLKYKGAVVRPHRLKKEGDPAPLKQENAPPSNKQEQKAASKSKAVEPEDQTKPKVTVVHRGEFNLEQTLGNFGKIDAPISSRPKQLVVRIELPLMKSAADMELETKGGFLELKVPGVYDLKHKLPFPVDDTSGDAKYNKTLKQLTVTLDVLPWKPEELAEEIARAKSERRAKEEEEEKKKTEEEILRKKKEEEEAKNVVKKGFMLNATGKKQTAARGENTPAEQLENLDFASDDGEGAQNEGQKRVLIEDLGECATTTTAAAQEVPSMAQVEAGEPPVNFRQNEQNVTMIVRVSGIDASTLHVNFARTRVMFAFTAVKDGQRHHYESTIHLWGDIEPAQCRRDLSDTNLVVILRKAVEDRWATFVGDERLAVEPTPAAQPPALPTDPKETAVPVEKKEVCEKEERRHVRFADTEAPSAAESMAMSAQRESMEQQGDENFTPAHNFGGSKEGFVFKMGELGLGYYRDTYGSQKQKAGAGPAQGAAAENEAGTAATHDEEIATQKEEALMDAYKKIAPKLGFGNNLMFELD